MNTLEQIHDILDDYKLESNIPVNHPYWDLLNDFRAGKLDVPVREYRQGPTYQKEGIELYESAKHSILRIKIQNILTSYNNKEPDIPFTNEYWFLLNQLRMMDRLEAQQ